MRIRVHTVEGSSLRWTMGGRCKVCKVSTQTDGGQRSAHGRGTADRGRGGRDGAQFPPARGRQSRPNRRRGINPMARTGGRPTGGTDSVADTGPEGSELLKAMTSCLDAQASVLAVCAGPAGTGQVGPVAAKSSSRRARRRRRGQPAADAVDGDTSRGGVPTGRCASQTCELAREECSSSQYTNWRLCQLYEGTAVHRGLYWRSWLN
ncbi:uncharacterized protein LOC132794876 [Drosophila nasuta]|uniref:uncharacterized protein LOC132794876 n=1 Tax=Drosophila nasuta TaxID=42062 RepID=UPI00295EE10A|nr:uncharacterized protein LOC132794876 [Drosophila nasuta]